VHISRLRTASDIPYCYQKTNKSVASEDDDATPTNTRDVRQLGINQQDT